MGNQQASQQLHEQNILQRYYGFNSDSVLGGSCGDYHEDSKDVLGGYDALQDYGDSVFSKSKEQLIRDIAKDVTGILQLNNEYAENAPIKDVIQKFKKIVPNPAKNKNFKAKIGRAYV